MDNMVSIGSLWLAILLSAVLVWIASALVWTVLPHHKKDFKGLPDEDAARNALTPQEIAPGQYNIPHITTQAEYKEPAIIKKWEEGPNAFITVLPKGVPSMGKSMALSFIFYLVIGFLVSYLTSRTLPAGAEYLSVFRVTGFTAWLAYGSVAMFQDAIWFGRPWSSVVKNLIDALLYGLLTAGVFGWLWPS